MELYISCYTYKGVFSVYGFHCVHTHALSYTHIHTCTHTFTHARIQLSSFPTAGWSRRLPPVFCRLQTGTGRVRRNTGPPPRAAFTLHWVLVPKVRVRNSTRERHTVLLWDFLAAGRGSPAPPWRHPFLGCDRATPEAAILSSGCQKALQWTIWSFSASLMPPLPTHEQDFRTKLFGQYSKLGNNNHHHFLDKQIY